MRGIELCLTWLLKNPRGMLKAKGWRKVRFNPMLGIFEAKNADGIWYMISNMLRFDDAYWEIVKEGE